MRENLKRTTWAWAKALLLLVMAVCSMFTVSGNAANAAEDASAYERNAAAELYQKGTFKVSGEDVTLSEDTDKKGVFVSGDAKALTNAVFEYGDAFDFQERSPEYMLIDGLAERKKKISLAFYLDDEKEPFVTVTFAKQKKKENWSTVKNCCINVENRKITGKHRISFRVITEETGKLTFLFRAVTFMNNGLPTVEFEIDETQGSISAMNGDSKHDTECYGNVTIKIPEGYHSEYSDKEYKTATYELDYIRGRGNSTWQVDGKKPYKFKLDKKQDLLGMGKNKHWVLLANYYDVSMLRNKLTYWLGDQLGMEFTPQCEFVDVVMNGEYLGSYYLAEQVRVGNSRVDIDDLEKDEETMKSTDESVISGGYLLSMYPYGDETKQSFSTERNINFLIESPSFEEYLNEAQLNFIKNYVQKTEDAIYGVNFKDGDGVSYQEYMDIDAAVDYYWIQEIAMNGDAFSSTSTYLYKKRNGKLFWGPLWDFDFVAWGATEYYENYFSGFMLNNNVWFGRLFDDPEFYQKVVDRWPVIREKLMEACADGGQIDIYSKKQYESQKHNYEIWDKYSDVYGIYWEEGSDEANAVSSITYDSEVERLKEWVKGRVDWIDENLKKLKKEYCTVKFMVDDLEAASIQVEREGVVREFPETPVKDGYVFDGWYVTSEEEEYKYQFTESDYVTEDLVVKAKWKKASEVTSVEKVVFLRNEYYMMKYDDIFVAAGVIPFQALSGKLNWQSSDENIATVYDGYVTAEGKCGDVTITATAENGVSASCVVHVVEYDEGEYLKEIQLAETELSVKKGEYAQLPVVLNPENAIVYATCSFASSDETVVQVNDCGYIYGVKAGTASVACYSSVGSFKFCKITVTDDSQVEQEPNQNTTDTEVKKGTAFTANGLKYKILSNGSKKTAACIGVTDKKSTRITVPNSVSYKNKTYKVTKLGKKAFANCKKLKKVTLGKNVTTVGKKAFTGCKQLKKVTIRSKKLKKTWKYMC